MTKQSENLLPVFSVYLSGPMSGLPDYNRQAFHDAAAMLRAVFVRVVSPAEIVVPGGDWHACMREDIKHLCGCTHLGLLKGWERSNGCHVELHLAHRLGLEIIPDIHEWLQRLTREGVL